MSIDAFPAFPAVMDGRGVASRKVEYTQQDALCWIAYAQEQFLAAELRRLLRQLPRREPG